MTDHIRIRTRQPRIYHILRRKHTRRISPRTVTNTHLGRIIQYRSTTTSISTLRNCFQVCCIIAQTVVFLLLCGDGRDAASACDEAGDADLSAGVVV